MLINIDEVTTGVLVSAIGAVGRWLGTAATAAWSGRGRATEDLAVARWFETYKLTARVPPDTSGMSPAASARLAGLLRGDDVQAAVQELLAVRLTDGSDVDAARAREAFVLTLAAAGIPKSPAMRRHLLTTTTTKCPTWSAASGIRHCLRRSGARRSPPG